jgi:hypothetical protein
MITIIIITPWPESSSELYRPSDRRLSVKLVPTLANREVPRGQRDGSLPTSGSVAGNSDYHDHRGSRDNTITCQINW